jgi:diketogulonate reductase-like aldo/keto reductase
MDEMNETIGGMPRLGFGTWQVEPHEAEEAVRDALDVGYRHIDTARMYGNEREVGRAIAGSGVARQDVWLTTKIWPDDFAADRLSAATEDSLRTLGVDQIDLLLLHWPSQEVPLTETLPALSAVRERGWAREIGVSNFPAWMLREALEIAPEIFNDQVEFHPFLAQDELLEIAWQHDLSITAYSPLAQGKVVRDPVIAQIAERLGRTPVQVALRYLLDQPRTVVIPKASSRERREENFDLWSFSLTEEDRAALDALPKDQRESDPSWGPDWRD